MVQVEVGRRPRHAQTKAPFPRVCDRSAAESPGCFCAVSRTLALPGDHLQTRRSGRRRNRQLLRSQRDIAPSVRVITNLAADWTKTRNSLLAEREKERASGD